ncbi:LuxR C-terminal-related transcriptional regulator [Phyllobacterium myrsinacearum]|uniref:DNA-binding NarL/FixJ family response regulator n=1 Tax=Phyllobacterium myrsinacearum TaxID=28101 RepID=A0A839EHG1_9HYPH|nr:LuxR C-terminal-related transcriptional regulator [Phyllobacterium myrsinacearum]MBA8879713.1 DNA-binding NarL/FixJ family response regulator [Phyllobacterium myrsinacearum]
MVFRLCQREILQLIEQGKSNNEIGPALDIPPFAVSIYGSALLWELDIGAAS